jgi:hypothetical protein
MPQNTSQHFKKLSKYDQICPNVGKQPSVHADMIMI